MIKKIKGEITLLFSPPYPGVSLPCKGELGLLHSTPLLCSEPFPGEASWLLTRRFCWETEKSNFLFLVCPTSPGWLCLGSSAEDPRVRKLFSVCGKKNMDFYVEKKKQTQTSQSYFFFAGGTMPNLCCGCLNRCATARAPQGQHPELDYGIKGDFFPPSA